MTQTALLYICIFSAAFLGLQFVINGGRQATLRVKAANDRMKRLEEGAGNEAVLIDIRRARALSETGERMGRFEGIDRMIVQSGLKLGATGFYWIWAASPVFLALVASIMTEGWARVGAAIVAGLVMPLFVLRTLVSRRQKKAVAQLPDALDVIVRSLRAGYPVPVALSLVAKEAPDPIGSEFGMVGDEVSYGSVVSVAIQRMADRIGHDDFALFSAVIRLQEKTGGNLAELLQSNAKTLRDRQKMRLKIKAASAEGRMSAMILNAAPIGLFLIINLTAPEFYGDVDHHPIIQYCFWGIIIWMALGNLIMRKMINFRI